VLTLKDAQKYKDLLAKQFSKIDAASNDERWNNFLEIKEAKFIPNENLPVVRGLLEGKNCLAIKDFRNIIIQNLKKFKYCTIIPVLFEMTEGYLMPELITHYFKITSIVLSEEDMLDAYTVRYRDSNHSLREFCTYARSTIDARLQALECIQYVASNPRCINDITQEKVSL
tara:strand:+ start:58 stop:570 length:513 start_codon:yes stop_codon:yes gene_type:complete